MTASTFNALAAARVLKAVGIERRQAEAIAEAIAAGMREAGDAVMDGDRGDIATKADIASLRASLATIRWTAGLPATKTDIEREIGALRSELRWFLGTLAALMLAMAASILAIAAKLFDVV